MEFACIFICYWLHLLLMAQMGPVELPASNHMGFADSLKILVCCPEGPCRSAPESYFRLPKFIQIDLTSYGKGSKETSLNLRRKTDLIDT